MPFSAKPLLLASACIWLLGCNYLLGVEGDPEPSVTEFLPLNPGNLAAFANYGSAVAIEGNLLVVGATGADGLAGAAYVFVRNGDWELDATLVPTDSTVGDAFGVAVAISEQRIIVGAAGHDEGTTTSAGAAYVFARNPDKTWRQEAILKASAPGTDHFFGLSVALAGNTALVGSPSTGATVFSGTAHFYEESNGTWSSAGEFSINNGAPGDSFGTSVDISETFAVVGARNDDSIGADAGAAYVFARSGAQWVSDSTLVGRTDYGPNGADGAQFGTSVAIHDNRIIVGAPGDEAAHVFVRSGSDWSSEEVLRPDQLTEDFGHSVALYDEIALVGAPGTGSDILVARSGSVYAFSRDDEDWYGEAKLTLEDTEKGDELGREIALHEDEAVFGVRLDSAAGVEAGSATWIRLGFVAP